MAGLVPAIHAVPLGARHGVLAGVRPPGERTCNVETWMAGTSPRLSGSCCAPSQLELTRVDRVWWVGLTQARDIFSMHEIGAHESNQFEEAVFFLGNLLQRAQQEKGDERDGDLNPYGGFRTSEEF